MNKQVPNSLVECFDTLLQVLSPEDFSWILNLRKDELCTTHHLLGRWIRNNWGLWEEVPNNLVNELKALGFQHPDDMSSSIIKEFWLRLHNKPSELQKDIAESIAYWQNIKGTDNDIA